MNNAVGARRRASPRTGNTGAGVLARWLLSLDVAATFGVHGANIEDVVDEIEHVGLPTVLAKHECGAGMMADGAARITGGIGVVMTTSGGGAMNVLPALAESYDSRVPVLAIIGLAPRDVGSGAFQDMSHPPETVDVQRLFSAVTRTCRLVTSSDELPDACADVERALGEGYSAALLVPKDVQCQSSSCQIGNGAVAPRLPRLSRDQAEHLTELAAQMSRAQRVVLWVGDEASRSELADQVVHLQHALDAAVVVTPNGRDLAGVGSLGVTGVMGHPSAHQALDHADLVVALGNRLSGTDRGAVDTSRVHAVGRWHPRSGVSSFLQVENLKAAIETLSREVSRRPNTTIRRWQHAPIPATVGLGTPDVMRAVSPLVRGHVNVFADAGNVGASAIHQLPQHISGRFVVALGMGGMGYSFGAGIGAAATTAVRSVVIAGDGAFYMHGMEIHTAVENHLPVTFVVCNNNAHAMCVVREQLYLHREAASANRFRPSRLGEGLAAMFPTLPTWTADSPSSLNEAVTEMSRDRSTGPKCLVVETDPDEVPPFMPFIKELS